VFSLFGSGAATLVAFRHLNGVVRQSSLHHANTLLEVMSVPVAAALEAHDGSRLERLVDHLVRQRSSDLEFLAVIEASGEVWSSSAADGHPSRSDLFPRGRETGSSWRAFGPDQSFLDVATVVRVEDRSATIRARFSLEPLHEQVAWFTRITALTTLLVAVLAWAVATLLLDHWLLKPIRTLSRVARRIGDGGLEVRSRFASSDELGDLSSALNATAERLSSYTRGLEQAVQERTAELEEANRELQRLATTDGLTGLLNHRAFQEVIAFELLRAKRHPREVALCMIDIDAFKAFNDTLGHPAGDELLREVARAIQESLRAIDIIARYGGEEFAVILLDTDGPEGLKTAQKICEAVRGRTFAGEEHQPGGRLTVSVGVAAYPEHAGAQAELIEKADLALYEAKRRGKDQAVLYEPSIRPRARTTDLSSAPPDDAAPPEANEGEQENSVASTHEFGAVAVPSTRPERPRSGVETEAETDPAERPARDGIRSS
jgi:diguanylate cyclase (GGDEF)-like protein